MKAIYFSVPLGALLLAGCGDSNRTIVRGTVHLDGKPVYRAGVQFWPKDDPALAVSLALTDREGRFTMKPRLEPYVKPGTYNVLIGRDVKKDGQVPDESRDDMRALSGKGALQNSLPARYFDRAHPAFVVEIKPGLNELPPFELSSN
jgi:hypothetical protein